MSIIQIFVYGTLKSGLYNNRLLMQGGATSLGPAHLESGDFVLVTGHSFPYAVPFKPEFKERLWDVGIQTTIVGELFKADEAILTRLDRLEGYPHHYNRAEVRVRSALFCENIQTALMYHRNESLKNGEIVCAHGEWWPPVSVREFKVARSTRATTARPSKR